jgi:uncharacterized protein involved in cysteine biosynthesis
MILDAAALSARNLFSPETRTVFWKTLGLTILVLIGLWLGLRESFIAFVMPMIQGFIPELPDWAGWLTFIFGILASIGLALALALLLSPVTAIIAGLFLMMSQRWWRSGIIRTIRPARRCRWERPSLHQSSFSVWSSSAISLR